MKLRRLSGALVLLLLANPLAATLCSGCGPDFCPMGKMSGEASLGEPRAAEAQGNTGISAAEHDASSTSGPSSTSGHRGQAGDKRDHASSTGHCGQAVVSESTPAEANSSPADHATLTVSTAAMDCCADPATPSTATAVVPTTTVSSNEVMATLDTLAPRLLAPQRPLQAGRLKPPRVASQRLFTLHSVLLI